MFRLSLAVIGVALILPSVGEAADYGIDKAHSSVVFKSQHLGVSHVYGAFADVDGTIKVDPANPASDAIDVTVKTDSITTHNTDRDKHLKSPDFFNVKQFPTMTFKSKSVSKVDANTLNVTGDFTLHGVTKPITIKATLIGTGKDPKSGTELIGYETTFDIKRSDYGMGFMVPAVGDDITVILAFEARKK